MSRRTSSRWVTLLALMLVSVMATALYSQSEPSRPQSPATNDNNPNRRSGSNGEGVGGGGGGERGGDFRQRMSERIKQSLNVTDEEWSVIQPRMEKVQRLQWQLRGNMLTGIGGNRGGRGGAMANELANTPVGKASQELSTLLEDKSVAPEQIKVKLEALRNAKDTVKKELTTAQQELIELLTERQEAELVVRGLLD